MNVYNVSEDVSESPFIYQQLIKACYKLNIRKFLKILPNIENPNKVVYTLRKNKNGKYVYTYTTAIKAALNHSNKNNNLYIITKIIENCYICDIEYCFSHAFIYNRPLLFKILIKHGYICPFDIFTKICLSSNYDIICTYVELIINYDYIFYVGEYNFKKLILNIVLKNHDSKILDYLLNKFSKYINIYNYRYNNYDIIYLNINSCYTKHLHDSDNKFYVILDIYMFLYSKYLSTKDKFFILLKHGYKSADKKTLLYKKYIELSEGNNKLISDKIMTYEYAYYLLLSKKLSRNIIKRLVFLYI